jgi:predicted DNA-binding transcriptional regulator YafY
MTDAIIDRVTVNHAAQELEISLRTLYRRCKEYDILPGRDGKESYLSADELQKLRSHQEQRGELSILGATRQRDALVLEQRQVDAIELVSAIAQLLPQPQRDILEPQQQLQIAADNQWLLTTEQLANVLGIAPRTVRSGGDRLGFRFERLGREWRVVKARSA